MKIAHIASNYDVINEKALARPLLIYLLAKKQSEEGHEVTILASPDSSVPGCDVVSFSRPPKKKTDRLGYWIQQRRDGADHYKKSYKYLDSSYDIIHSHMMEEGMAFSRYSKSPCIVTQHGTAPINLHHRMIFDLYSIPRKTKIVAVSKYQYQAHKQLYGKDVIDYVYNCLDFNKFPFQTTPETTAGITLSFLGRCVPEKGIHVAIQVAELLHSQQHDVELNIFTSPYPGFIPYFKEIEEQANKSNFIKLHIRKSTPVVMSQIRNSDATLFPILWEEPFGYVQIESMACGTPVVAFPRGAVPEIVTPGVSGYYCKNIEQMAQAALRCRDLNREKIRRYAEERYSITSSYEKYLDLYKKVINKNV